MQFSRRNKLVIVYNVIKKSFLISCSMISAGNLSVCGRNSTCGFVRGVMCIDIKGVAQFPQSD